MEICRWFGAPTRENINTPYLPAGHNVNEELGPKKPTVREAKGLVTRRIVCRKSPRFDMAELTPKNPKCAVTSSAVVGDNVNNSKNLFSPASRGRINRRCTHVLEHDDAGMSTFSSDGDFITLNFRECHAFCGVCDDLKSYKLQMCFDCLSAGTTEYIYCAHWCVLGNDCCFKNFRNSYVRLLTRENIESNPGPRFFGRDWTDDESPAILAIQGGLEKDGKFVCPGLTCDLSFKSYALWSQHNQSKHGNMCMVCFKDGLFRVLHECVLQGAALPVVEKSIEKITRPVPKPKKQPQLQQRKCDHCKNPIDLKMTPEKWKAHEPYCTNCPTCPCCTFRSRDEGKLIFHVSSCHGIPAAEVKAILRYTDSRTSEILGEFVPPRNLPPNTPDKKEKGKAVEGQVRPFDPLEDAVRAFRETGKQIPRTIANGLIDMGFDVPAEIIASSDDESSDSDSSGDDSDDDDVQVNNAAQAGPAPAQPVVPAAVNAPVVPPRPGRPLPAVPNPAPAAPAPVPVVPAPVPAPAVPAPLPVVAVVPPPVPKVDPNFIFNKNFSDFSHVNPNVARGSLLRTLGLRLIGVVASACSAYLDWKTFKLTDVVKTFLVNKLSPRILPPFTFVLNSLRIVSLLSLFYNFYLIYQSFMRIKRTVDKLQIGWIPAMKMLTRTDKVHWIRTTPAGFHLPEPTLDKRHDSHSSRDFIRKQKLANWLVISYAPASFIGKALGAHEDWSVTRLVVSESVVMEGMGMKNMSTIADLNVAKVRIDQFISSLSIVNVDRDEDDAIYNNSATMLYGLYLNLVKERNAKLGFLPPQ